jgi:hypothetical protein
MKRISKIRNKDKKLILDSDKIATIWKQYFNALYEEGETAIFNNNNNPDMQKLLLRDKFNKTFKVNESM